MPAPFIMGWEEWVALPDLGLPAIKAKVDTGARTSALHAHLIEPFGPAESPLVRFSVHPVAGRTDVEIICSAPIIGRRDVTSSNGERERRFVITTNVQVGARAWPIEITLTNRDAMAYRMLLGRQAIQEDMFIDPAASFRQTKLSYKPYKHMPRRDPVRRALRIAIVSARPDAPGTNRLAAEAKERGHVVETIALDRVKLLFNGILPGLQIGREQVGHFDVVIPRIGGVGSPFARNVIRQLEAMGSVSLNRADALDRLANPITVRQVLIANGVPTAGPALIDLDTPKAEVNASPSKGISSILVIGRSAAAVIPGRPAGSKSASSTVVAKGARRIAVQAARHLKLRLAAIDVATSGDRHAVVGVSAVPHLDRFARETGIAPEAHILSDIEKQVRSWVRHTESEAETPPP